MKLISTTYIFFLPIIIVRIYAQDTFSIVAADSTTREVGSAGASCVDLFAAGFSDATFIGDLLPDTGAINTQAFYLEQNQDNARVRMRAGDTPTEIINWLFKQDAGDNPAIRQYGIVGFTNGNVSAAGFTGAQTNAYKNHKVGSIHGIHYSIQGNILKGQEIIDSMESRFRNAHGDLACRLMAALQGANVIGADTRCTPDGTSSLFAYVKVAKPTDTYGNPYLGVSVRTQDNSHIEPIDSLQVLFDLEHSCAISGVKPEVNQNKLHAYPNPTNATLVVKTEEEFVGNKYQIMDAGGKVVANGKIAALVTSVDISSLVPGVYFIHVKGFSPYRFLKI